MKILKIRNADHYKKKLESVKGKIRDLFARLKLS